uniref:hypothetical protein n=1 Tax=Tritonibacter horizontis TaxID=1768241 RepID=UPI0038CD3CA8
MVIASKADDDGEVDSTVAFDADAFTISKPKGNGAATPFAVYTSRRASTWKTPTSATPQLGARRSRTRLRATTTPRTRTVAQHPG